MSLPDAITDDLDHYVAAAVMEPGEPEAGFAPGHHVDIRQGIRNGDFVDPPPNPDLPINDTDNKLPGWRPVNLVGSAGSALWLPDPGTGSGASLRISLASGAAGDSFCVEAVSKVSSTAGLNWAYRALSTLGGWTISAGYMRFNSELQFLTADGTPTGSPITATLLIVAPGYALTWDSGPAAALAPADAKFARTRFGVDRHIAADAATIDLTILEARLLDGTTGIYFADQTDATLPPASLEYANGQVTLTGALSFPAILAPQITANQNDWNPTGYTKATQYIRCFSDAVRDITGLSSLFAVPNGRLLLLSNVGAWTITLKHASGSSSIQNQFFCPGLTDYLLEPSHNVWLVFDPQHHLWRVIGPRAVVPGRDVQPYDAELAALAGLASIADRVPYFTGTGTAALASFRDFARALLAAGVPAANQVPYYTSSSTAALTDLTAAGRALIDDADAAAQRTTLGLGTAATLASDTDGTLAANSDTKVATQKATKTYVDTAVTGLLEFKGATDCSSNPNYPAASKGDTYVVSVAGKIGGASGKSVEIGDMYLATADNAGGTEASVGTNWTVLEHNLVGALLAGNNLSDVTPATARTNLGVGTGDSPQFAAINLGHASDTTLARTGAGDASIEGNAIYRAGGTDVPVADGGTGASNAGAARTNLGLVIGTDVQAQDPELAALAGLTSAANKMPVFTGSGTAALTAPPTPVMVQPAAWRGAANLTTDTALVSATTYALYLGRAVAANPTIEVWHNVTVAAVAAITWAELGVASGAVPTGGGASTTALTTRGTTSVAASYNSAGRKSTTITTTGIDVGDNIWLLLGSSAATPFQVRAGLADDVRSGAFASAAVRPSTMGAGTTFTAAAATVAVPMTQVALQ